MKPRHTYMRRPAGAPLNGVARSSATSAGKQEYEIFILTLE